jgi:hypothetical protein
MADRIYGLDRGDTEFDMAEQATSPTKDVELVVDLAVSLEKSEVLLLIDMIKNHIIKGNWPPA